MKTPVVLALMLLTALPAHAAGSPGAKCAAAKIRATAKKAAAKGACHAKAVASGSLVDPGCLDKAEQKFAAALARAEGRGGCATTGDAATLEDKVDAFIADVVGALPATTSTTTTSTTTTSSTTTVPTCIPDCTLSVCGPDGCGGSCGTCPAAAPRCCVDSCVCAACACP